MARRRAIGDDGYGPVAESVDARAVHRSLSWFKSRPGLQPSLASPGLAGQPSPEAAGRLSLNSEGGKMPVDWGLKGLSRLQNLF